MQNSFENALGLQAMRIGKGAASSDSFWLPVRFSVSENPNLFCCRLLEVAGNRLSAACDRYWSIELQLHCGTGWNGYFLALSHQQ